METKIKSITLLNFKGVRKQEVEFDAEMTRIHGANGTGKSTLAEAYQWLIFGKSCDGRDTSNISIRTLDADGKPIPKLEHEVRARIVINDKDETRDLEIRRIFKEKWVRPTGCKEEEYRGNTEEFYWDGIQITATQWANKIREIDPDQVWQLTSNPRHFASIEWKERRERLIQIAGEIKDEDIILRTPELKETIEEMASLRMTPDQYRERLNAENRRLNTTKKEIPAKIEECERMIYHREDGLLGSYADLQVATLTEKINSCTSEIEAAQGQADSIAAQIRETTAKVQNIQRQKTVLKDAAYKDAHKAQQEAYAAKMKIERDLDKATKDYEAATAAFDKATKDMAAEKAELDRLGAEFDSIDAEEFKLDENTLVCPTCGRPLEGENRQEVINQALAEFEKERKVRLDKINAAGVEATKKMAALGNESQKQGDNMRRTKTLQNALQKQLDEFIIPEVTEINVEETDAWIALDKQEKTELAKLETIGSADEETIRRAKEQRTTLTLELDTWKHEQHKFENNVKLEKRIDELNTQQQETAALIAENESKMYLAELYNRERMSLVEERVNAQFGWVKFRLFDTLVSGATKETCEILIDGAPYKDACTSKKLNAGLDIINTLSRAYHFSAPIWIDNAEGINEIRRLPGHQIITLSVSEAKEITIQ